MRRPNSSSGHRDGFFPSGREPRDSIGPNNSKHDMNSGRIRADPRFRLENQRAAKSVLRSPAPRDQCGRSTGPILHVLGCSNKTSAAQEIFGDELGGPCRCRGPVPALSVVRSGGARGEAGRARHSQESARSDEKRRTQRFLR